MSAMVVLCDTGCRINMLAEVAPNYTNVDCTCILSFSPPHIHDETALGL